MVNSIDNIMNDIMNDIIEEEVSQETYGIVDTFDEWDRIVCDIQNSHVYLPAIIDRGGMVYLSKSPRFKGFMTGPVAVFEGTTLAAATRKVLDISEFRDLIADKSIFLYTVLFRPNFPVYTENGNLHKLDKPYISSEPPCWIIRYAELD